MGVSDVSTAWLNQALYMINCTLYRVYRVALLVTDESLVALLVTVGLVDYA